MCANGSPGSTFPAKVRNTGRVASSSLELVTTMSRIGCACASDLFPHPECLEQPAAGRDDGGGPRVAARARRQRRIGHNNGNIGAKALTQRQRQRQARERAAADDNATLCRHVETRLLASRNYTCYLIIAGRNRAEKQGFPAQQAVIPGRALARTGMFR